MYDNQSFFILPLAGNQMDSVKDLSLTTPAPPSKDKDFHSANVIKKVNRDCFFMELVGVQCSVFRIVTDTFSLFPQNNG